MAQAALHGGADVDMRQELPTTRLHQLSTAEAVALGKRFEDQYGSLVSPDVQLEGVEEAG